MNNLYLLEQSENEDWDTYDSCIVCAKSEDDARKIHPSKHVRDYENESKCDSWVIFSLRHRIRVSLIGVACDWMTKNTVILSSFNAG